MSQTKNKKASETEKNFLKSYDRKEFDAPSIAADMAVFTVSYIPSGNYRKLTGKQLQILLVQRADYPEKGKYALPGGFVQPNETFEEAAAKHLENETGVTNAYLSQLQTVSDLNRDARGWIVSASYIALIDSFQLELKSGKNQSIAKWFDVFFEMADESTEDFERKAVRTRIYNLVLSCGDTKLTAKVKQTVEFNMAGKNVKYEILENDGLAFDHAKITAMAIIELKRKVKYENVAFNLCPEYFPLSDLQSIYECILGTNEGASNFRRKVKPLVVQTEQYSKENSGHRPSRLFKRNESAFFGD